MRADGEHVPNRPVRLWQAAVAVVLSSLVLVFVALAYTNKAVAQSDHQWCSLLVLLDDTNQKRDPKTLSEEQRKYVEELHRIRVGKGC